MFLLGLPKNYSETLDLNRLDPKVSARTPLTIAFGPQFCHPSKCQITSNEFYRFRDEYFWSHGNKQSFKKVHSQSWVTDFSARTKVTFTQRTFVNRNPSLTSKNFNGFHRLFLSSSVVTRTPKVVWKYPRSNPKKKKRIKAVSGGRLKCDRVEVEKRLIKSTIGCEHQHPWVLFD